MKELMEKLRAMKGTPWLLVLVVCAAACLLLPVSGQETGSMTEEEKRFSATLSRIAGAGETQVSIYYAEEASGFGGGSRSPVGAVIVSQGAGNIAVRLDLLRAAETLLGLPASQVEVFEMENAP